MPQETNLSNSEHIECILYGALNSIANARMLPMSRAKDLLLKTAVKLIRAALDSEE